MPNPSKFNTLALSHLTPRPDFIIAASSACEVQYPRLESPGFSARLHYSGKLRMRGSVPSPRVAWLFSPTPLQRQALHARFSTLAPSRLASQPDSVTAARSACEVQYPRLESPGFSARLRYSGKLRMRGSVPWPRFAWLLSPTPLQWQPPHARFSTLASSRLASQPDSITAASSACEVQYPHPKSPGFSARLHYSGKLHMRGSVPSPRVAWLLSPTPLQR
ncbi:unnamed protein product [Lactuca virosa]|uniref:Uncharacterized protein n=1 Tax=Lactuca virosa TaxID=75947 RepID=A0AAU9LFC8_9ASTR|nr:unnamed protein product [Lactuca virosa]